MTQLSKLSTLGIAREATPGTYAPPVAGIPFSKADFEDKVDPIRDESWRGNDTVLQGVYQGVSSSEWDIEVNGYPDLIGHLLRGTIGPDTVTAGVSTTLSSATAAGASSISVAATIPAGSVIRIDTAAATEYAMTGTPTGSGPSYTIPLVTQDGASASLAGAHESGVVVVSQTRHTFRQDPTQAIPSYSLTVNDTTQTLGYAGFKFTEMGIKIDPKAAVTFDMKGLGPVGAAQAPVAETYTKSTPNLGWTWTTTQAGAASTRGLTLDLTIKRDGEAIASSDGTQGPREIFVGALEADGTYKAIFENQDDMGAFLNGTQLPLSVRIATPVPVGGQSLAITMSRAAWTTGKRDLGQNYVQADYAISGVYNTTDGGAVTAVLANWTTTAY
ncbi:phage tail tube protein [Streptomyces sp. NPDC092296]|uniref:phage tail tube protein n=1 Tax=Streptomyces sp. NPDC092296 TaxID=3366012 RepID=UPI00381899C7